MRGAQTGMSRIQSDDLYGTVVVEGNGSPAAAASRDLSTRTGSRIWTADRHVYGYPV